MVYLGNVYVCFMYYLWYSYDIAKIGDKEMKIEDIVKKEIQKKAPKWAILKNEAGAEIEKMIQYGIPLKRQIEIILEAGIVEKLDRKEYHNMLIKHFGYEAKKRSEVEEIKEEIATVSAPKKRKKFKKPVAKKQAVKKTGTAADKLSENVDLMAHFLEKQAAEV